MAFSVVAIVAAYNEADIIGHVVGDLIDQGIHVYVLDDGSTDDTVGAVEPYVGRGVLAIERRSAGLPGERSDRFEWERILRRKAQLAAELDADWFIHHDADEFRESPWADLSLKDSIRHVDTLGFNAIDFIAFEFWPVHDRFIPGDDVRRALTFCAEAPAHDRLQIRCWKKTAGVDLASSGGHEAQFAGRRVFPTRFLLRHYPIRGQAHGERKIFRERRTRFTAEERARGWHVQYDNLQEGASFIRDASTLTPYDPVAARVGLSVRHRDAEALEQALGDARSTAEAQRLEIQRRDEALDSLRAEVTARGAAAEALRIELEARAAQLDAQAADLARTRGELDRSVAAGATLRQSVDRQAGKLRHLQNLVAEATRQIDDLHRSLSWRWTSPARAVVRLLTSWKRSW